MSVCLFPSPTPYIQMKHSHQLACLTLVNTPLKNTHNLKNKTRGERRTVTWGMYKSSWSANHPSAPPPSPCISPCSSSPSSSSSSSQCWAVDLWPIKRFRCKQTAHLVASLLHLGRHYGPKGPGSALNYELSCQESLCLWAEGVI